MQRLLRHGIVMLSGALGVSLWARPATAQVGNMFFGPPCRVFDAGVENRDLPLVDGEERTVQVTGACGVPADATAVFLAITVTEAGGAGYLAIYESGATAPRATAIEYPAAVTVTNDIAVGLANGIGSLQVFASSGVKVALDVVGYAGGQRAVSEWPAGPFGYRPVSGCRLVDTREEGGVLQGYEERPIAVQGRCNIPDSAPVAMLNVTTLAPEESGGLELYPSDERPVGLGKMGLRAGNDVAAAMPVRLAQTPGGDVVVQNDSRGGVDVVVDAQGYFDVNAPSMYRAVTPCRLFDTRERDTPLISGEPQTFSAAACRGALPVGGQPVAVFVNLTVVSPESNGEVVATLPDSTDPIVSTLMAFTAGKASLGHGSPLELDKEGSFALLATTKDGSPVHVVADVYGYFDAPTSFVEGGSSLVLADGIHPAAERGVDPDKLYEFGGIDNVNLANGNLSIKLPIGNRYPVGGGLSYGLQLAYNAKNWDYLLRRVSTGTGHWIIYTEAIPNRVANAGLGWMLSLGGRLLSPSDEENNSGGPLLNGQRQDPQPQWLWIDPDGAEHIFHHQLNALVDGPIAGTLWTRDGTYLRLSDDGTNFKKLEFPDGTVYRFQLKTQQLFGGVSQNRWLLVKMQNSYAGNSVTVDYVRLVAPGVNEIRWVIKDSHNRRQDVVFEPDPAGNPAGRAKLAELTASHGEKAVWELVYQPDNGISFINRCHDTWYGNKDTAPVSLLQAVKMPTSPKTAFAMTYELGSVPPASCQQGLLTRLALPTAGNESTLCNGGQHCAGMEWSYGDYQLPLGACDGRTHFSRTPGVVEKRVYATTGLAQPTGKWTFQPSMAVTSDPTRTVICSEDFPIQRAVEYFYTYTNTVTNLLNDQTVHHFSVLPRPNHEVPAPPSVAARWQEFGLPLNRSVSINGSDGKPLYLSQEIKDCSSPTSCTTAAKKYVRYDRDRSLFILSWPSSDHYDLHRRPVAERMVHLPGKPEEHFVETARTDFDGVGHYRNTVGLGGGWNLAGGARTMTTFYNPESHTYSLDDDDQTTNQHDYVSLAGRMPWKLDTFVSVGRTQGSSAEGERSCFDAATGFLERRRLYANGVSAGARDVIVVYTGKGDQGNVKSETFYGGDRASSALNTNTDVCAGNFPFPAAEYATARDYSGGLPSSMAWKDGAATVLQRYLATVDVNGARVVSTTEADGIRTDYHYDLMGRLEWIKPGGANAGQSEKFSAWTRFSYGTAAAGGCVDGNLGSCASMLVERFSPGSFTGTPLDRRRYRYDGLGRLIRDGIGTPGLAATDWSEIVRSYDAVGQVVFRSERHTTNPQSYGTSFQDLDVFGRPARVVSADGKTVDFTYVGLQSETRTTKIARFDAAFVSGQPLPSILDKASAKTTTFDHLHRVARVLSNPTGATNNQLKTDYLYDVGDRLTGVRMTELATNVLQSRDFAYDSLGRLRSEDHPELSHDGTATVCGSVSHKQNHDVVYEGYDALGNLLRKCDDEVDLAFKYDRAQRLTEVRLAGNQPNLPCTSELGTCLEKRLYGIGTSAGSRSAGKLVQASSFNYRRDTAPSGAPLFAVGELVYDYSYDGTVAVDGGLSSRTLRFNASTNPNQAPQPATEKFTQNFSYTPLGLPAKVDYPTCEFAGCTRSPRSISLGYTEGLLTNVSGYATLSYWPHPMLRRATFSDGRIWQQDPDVSHLPRPRFICAPAAGTPASTDCSVGLGPYAYDTDGNVKEVGGERYVYDAHGQVVYGQMSSGQYERFVYDLFGNIQTKWYGTNAGGNAADSWYSNLPTSLTTNRLAGANYGYDKRGNLTAWDGNTYSYDERGRLGVVHQGGRVRWHFYDVDGERVLTFEPPEFPPNYQAAFDWTLRGPDGKALRWLRLAPINGTFAWTWKKDYVYRNGVALAYETPAGRGTYLVDHLGTPRIVWGENGSASGHHFYPFGEEIFFQPGDSEAIKFTGHERDLFDLNGPQDDVDYVHARYYNPQLARFHSADRFDVLGQQWQDPGRFAELLQQPGSWNRYAYSMGNPLKYTDPDGEAFQLALAGAGAGAAGTATAGTGTATTAGGAALTAGALPVVAAGLAGVALGYGVNQIPGFSDLATVDAFSEALSNVFFAQKPERARDAIDTKIATVLAHITTYGSPTDPDDRNRKSNIYNKMKGQLRAVAEKLKDLRGKQADAYRLKLERTLEQLEEWWLRGGSSR